MKSIKQYFLNVESSQEHSKLHQWEMEKIWNYTDSSLSWPSDKTEQPGKKDFGQGGEEEPNDYSDRTTQFLG